jgi:hypothetical protein
MAKTKKDANNHPKPVLVTTEHRGVFGGLLRSIEDDTAVLENARMVVYWSAAMHGVLGLAKHGPNKECRVSPAAPRLTLRGVTAIAEMTPEAWAAWQAEPWAE